MTRMWMVGAVVLGMAACDSTADPAMTGSSWSAAGPALHSSGIASYRVLSTGTADGRQTTVELRDESGRDLGRVELDQHPQSFAAALELDGSSWTLAARPDRLELELTLDGRSEQLIYADEKWTGSQSALALWNDSQPKMELVRTIAEQAGLEFGPSAPPRSPQQPQTPALNLCCSTVPINASAFAWLWQAQPTVEACTAARNNLAITCQFGTAGLGCCPGTLPPPNAASGCACVYWGLGYTCTATAYLRYVC